MSDRLSPRDFWRRLGAMARFRLQTGTLLLRAPASILKVSAFGGAARCIIPMGSQSPSGVPNQGDWGRNPRKSQLVPDLPRAFHVPRVWAARAEAAPLSSSHP